MVDSFLEVDDDLCKVVKRFVEVDGSREGVDLEGAEIVLKLGVGPF